MNSKLSTIFVITGDIGSGKTTLAVRLSEMARERGYTVGGIIAHRRFDQQSGIREYWTECLLSGKSWLFATTRKLVNPSTPGSPALSPTESGAGGRQLGKFYFPLSALSRASRCLRQSAQCDYVLIDELGPLELAGGGLWRATRFLLDHSSAPKDRDFPSSRDFRFAPIPCASTRLILVIRRSILDGMLSALRLNPDLTLDTAAIPASSYQEVADKIFS